MFINLQMTPESPITGVRWIVLLIVFSLIRFSTLTTQPSYIKAIRRLVVNVENRRSGDNRQFKMSRFLNWYIFNLAEKKESNDVATL